MAENKWTKPVAPPPPLFLGEKERDLVKQVNDEVIERIIGQAVLYMPLSIEYSKFHPLYGEAIEKSFLPPVRVHALVKFEGRQTKTENFGLDKEYSITVKFHQRRLFEDQNLYIKEGDYLMYGESFFEIVKLAETRELFGQFDSRFELEAKCIRTRRGLIDLTVLPSTIHQALVDNAVNSQTPPSGDGGSSGETGSGSGSGGSSTLTGTGASIVYGPADSGTVPAGAIETSLSEGDSINAHEEFTGFFGAEGTSNPVITPNTILIFQNGILQSVGNDSTDTTDFYITEDYDIRTSYNIPAGDRLTIIALEAIVAAFES